MRRRIYACEQRTVGQNCMKSTRRVLGHSLVRSLIRSHRSLIRLLRTTRFARSLTHSLPSSWESGLCLYDFDPLCNASQLAISLLNSFSPGVLEMEIKRITQQVAVNGLV